jgi:prepilin-type N-terminal cleavage/methylation domain-containing protein
MTRDSASRFSRWVSHGPGVAPARAFTLIELIVVVTIISVLIGLILPAIQSAREAARRAQCTNNLLQLGVALANYASAHNVLPPGVVERKGPILNLPTGYHYSWAVQILPFLEQNNVYRRFDFRYGVYHPSNVTAQTTTITTFLCTSSTRPRPISYAGCHHDVDAPIDANNRGVLYLNSRIGYDDVTDGLACTILLGEIIGGGPTLGWASGTRATLRNTGHGLNEPDYLFRAMGIGPFVSTPRNPTSPGEMAKLVDDGLLPVAYTGGFSSMHRHGTNFLFCNGAVRFVSQSVNRAVYQHLGNRNDNEIVSDDAF